MSTLMVCERSGGHIFPALVIAGKIREKYHNEDITFFVTAEFLKEYLQKENYRVVGKSFLVRNILWEGLWRFGEAIVLLIKLKPKRIIGFGGRDSIFLVLLGALFGADTAIYEPNVVMGKANSLLANFVKQVLCGFSGTFSSARTKVLGIPLRGNIKRLEKQSAKKMLGLPEDKPVIFCFGGSQGSTFLNLKFMKLVQSLPGDFSIIHLIGKRDYVRMNDLYEKINKNKFVKDFYYDMEVLYSAADVIICRAGASTLAEVAYYRLPAIFIPHSQAGGHQKDNAFYFRNREAGEVILEKDFSSEEFSLIVEKFLYDQKIREKIIGNLEQINIGREPDKFTNVF
jgi:UDP-N-acetylglucosamine--N-acetylmuramyl-(pentapeptide) pyrophosphoryl-undecaprenol N-acetylglucosamine transferase